jgi:hypothetical protein
MQALEAVNESVWAMAHHPSSYQITGMGYKNQLGFTVCKPYNSDSFFLSHEEDLAENLQDLGIDDNNWVPDGLPGVS